LRYGILSDIHSNLSALDQVLAELDAARVDALLCLGDVVGSGPNPNECCTALRARKCMMVMGNHDEGALSNEHDAYFNQLAQQAIAWTRKTLTPENRQFLASLPNELIFDGFELVHGSTAERFDYILDAPEALRALQHAKKPITFFGHSHIAEVYYQSPEGKLFHERLPHGGSVSVEAGFRYLINPGSVGQPRDRNPQASYAIFDEKARNVEIRRATYDIAQARQRMEEAHLPDPLSSRLSMGV
jgi:predicted phosphodiesterase